MPIINRCSNDRPQYANMDGRFIRHLLPIFSWLLFRLIGNAVDVLAQWQLVADALNIAIVLL